MATSKQEYTKTVSYIKHDIALAEETINETREALGYLSKLPLHLRKQYSNRVNRYHQEIEKQQTLLTRYKRELRDFIKEVNFSKDYVDSIKPATDEELARDYEQDMAELSNPRATEVSYNKGQHLEIVAYCKGLQLKGLEQ